MTECERIDSLLIPHPMRDCPQVVRITHLVRLKRLLRLLPPWPFRCRPRGCRGFSLLELLMVIAVVTIISTLATTAFANLVRVHRINRTLDRITKALELAREDAMARQTYIWIGFRESDPLVIAPLIMTAGDLSAMGRAAMATTLVRPLTFSTDDLKSLAVAGGSAVNFKFKVNPASPSVTPTATFAFTPQGQVVSGTSITTSTPCVDEIRFDLGFLTGEKGQIRIDGQSGAITQSWTPPSQ
jgi:prepilin-type N-terminal cleavage/methylation domain-containing protein